MASHARAALNNYLAEVPRDPGEWTREQRTQYAALADRVTAEEAGPDNELPAGKSGGGLIKRLFS